MIVEADVLRTGPCAEAPDFFKDYLENLALIERLHRLLLDVIKDAFERRDELEVNPVQALLIFNIGTREVTAGELRSRGYYQGSNVSYNLKRLVELGYMSHQRCEVDRRSVRVRLTPRGHRIRDLVAEVFSEHANEMLERRSVDPETMARTLYTLRRFERFWTDQIRYIY